MSSHQHQQLSKLNFKTQNLTVYQLPNGHPNTSSSSSSFSSNNSNSNSNSNGNSNQSQSYRKPQQLVQHQTFHRGVHFYANSHMNANFNAISKFQPSQPKVNQNQNSSTTTIINQHNNSSFQIQNYHQILNQNHNSNPLNSFPNGDIHGENSRLFSSSISKVKLPVSNSITITNVQGPVGPSAINARIYQNNHAVNVHHNNLSRNSSSPQQKKNIPVAISSTIAKSKPRQEVSMEVKVLPRESSTKVKSVPEVKKKSFQKGADVLFTADDGTHIFGSVGMVHGDTLQVLFGDGTQQLARFDRVKLLSDDDDDEQVEEVSKSVTVISKSTKMSNNNNGIVEHLPSSEEVTCGSCGVVKKVAGKKALSFAPYTNTQFNCRRCLNKSRCGKNNSMPITTILVGSGNGSLNSGNSIQSSATTIISTKPTVDHQRDSLEINKRDACFHCQGKTQYNDRLHCNLCEKSCHLSCLAMTPTPLEGDRFWDVICSACGTQNGDSGSSARSKVFSCRRSISSWSDVAYLALSCLSCKPENMGERFFDLDLHIIPFIEKNLDRLHLPRMYKSSQREQRRGFLNTALTNATLRFVNGKDANRRHSLWAIRESNTNQGYPMRVMSPRPANQCKNPARSPNSVEDAKVGFMTASTKWVQSAPHPKDLTKMNQNPISRNPALANLPPSTTIIKSPVKTSSSSPNEGGSSRTIGFKNLAQNLSKKVPELSTSPVKTSPNRLITERLVMKAKRQSLKKPQAESNNLNCRPTSLKIETLENTENANKRKPSPTKSSSSTPSKRIKLLDQPSTPYDKTSSSVESESCSSNDSDFKIADAFKKASAQRSNLSPLAKTPSPSSKTASLIGKAVKSAGITPPGTSNLRTPEKPLLRIRKPKTLNLNLKKEKEKTTSGSDPSVSPSQTPERPQPPNLIKKMLRKGLGKRGRPTNISLLSRAVPASDCPAPPDTEKDDSETPLELSIPKATIKDLAYHGVGYSIECLPKAPQNQSDLLKLRDQVTLALKSEKNVPPAYWKSELKYRHGANSYMPWQKSERDLENPDSYTIVGKWINEKGQVRYYVEWKDGYGNDCSDDDTGPVYEMNERDLDNPNVLLEKLDQMEVEGNPPSASGSDLTVTSSSSNDDIVISSDATSTTAEPSYTVKFDSAERSVMNSNFFVSGLGQSRKDILNATNGNGNGKSSNENARMVRSVVQSDMDIIDLTDSP